MLTIAEGDKRRVYVYVPGSAYPFRRWATPATLAFDEFPKRVFKGSVVRFATSLDRATRTMLAEIDLDNPGRLLYPRSYAHVTLDLVRHPDALSIPSAAVQGAGDSARAYRQGGSPRGGSNFHRYQ